MTQNQLAYQANLERERSNRASESLTHIQNVERERSNRQNEMINQQRADADTVQAAVQEFRAELEAAKTEAQVRELAAKVKRYQVQNGVDISNAVTGGLRNVGTFFKDIVSAVRNVSSIFG